MTEQNPPSAPEEMSDDLSYADLKELADWFGCSVATMQKMVAHDDWSMWRQVEEKMMEDDILTLAFLRYCKRGDSAKSFVENYMKADLPTRCIAALHAVRSSPSPNA